jgi:hypothetical protein
MPSGIWRRGDYSFSMMAPDERNPIPPASPVAGELLDAPSERDARLTKVNERLAELLSYWMDSVFVVPHLGWRFGLDPLIGLVPIAGDLATTLVSFYILSLAIQLRVPRATLARMALNVGIDSLVGGIPLVGNVFDFAWKANDRNMKLLKRSLATPSTERMGQTMWDWLIVGGALAALGAALVSPVVLIIWLLSRATS